MKYGLAEFKVIDTAPQNIAAIKAVNDPVDRIRLLT
jgi:hypothetical protein